MNQDQLKRMSEGKGFIAALDQSGGSTPKALKTMVLMKAGTARMKRCSTWFMR